MTQLGHKRASASRRPRQLDKDYDVLVDGKVVGRIYEPRDSRFGPPELRWGWSVTAIVPAIPQRDVWHRGDARRGEGEVSGGSAVKREAEEDWGR
jgi:hypothetical protein